MLTGCTLALLLALPAKEKPKLPTTKEEFAALAKEYPTPRWLPYKNNPKRVAVNHVDGIVVGVGDEFIEILPNGKQQAVKYPAHVLLVTGAVCHWETDCDCYLLDDLKKGDVVVLGVGTIEEEKGAECFYVCIRERPGGVIPASRKPSEPKPYHLRRQAEIDRGGPPAKKLDPILPAEKKD